MQVANKVCGQCIEILVHKGKLIFRKLEDHPNMPPPEFPVVCQQCETAVPLCRAGGFIRMQVKDQLPAPPLLQYYIEGYKDEPEIPGANLMGWYHVGRPICKRCCIIASHRPAKICGMKASKWIPDLDILIAEN